MSDDVRADDPVPPAVSRPIVRLATAADLPAINAIYNHFVLCSTCTYQTEPSTAAEREAWFTAHGPQHPITVAEVDGEVLAWASLSRFHARAAYSRTVENSVYVRHDCHRRGMGSLLLADSIGRARSLGHHTIIAGIDAEQTASIELHRRHGFIDVARLREVGFKLGRWLDVVYLQRMLGENP